MIFCQGELLCGVLDKSQFGASQYGFVHSVYEVSVHTCGIVLFIRIVKGSLLDNLTW